MTAVEKTTYTISEDTTTLRSVHIDSKKRRKALNPSLIGLLLILCNSEIVTDISAWRESPSK
jgi:hypothetical protein